MSAIHIFLRTAKEAVFGGLIASGAAASFVLFGSSMLSPADPDVVRENEFMVANLSVAIIGGWFVGALAGTASGLPKRGVSLPRSVIVVAALAVLSRFTSLAPGYAIIVGAIAVLIYGLLRSHRVGSTGIEDTAAVKAEPRG